MSRRIQVLLSVPGGPASPRVPGRLAEASEGNQGRCGAADHRVLAGQIS
jgi:hypothetical protein